MSGSRTIRNIVLRVLLPVVCQPECGRGLELPAKIVQASAADNSSIAMTVDTHGHRFPQSNDGSALATAERRLLRVRAAS
jgi:hypothetical protein